MSSLPALLALRLPVGLAEDGEAAVGYGGAHECTCANDDESQSHHFQLCPHFLLVGLQTRGTNRDTSSGRNRGKLIAQV